ncbi:MAG: hypothetical protein ACR2GD_11360 [Pyrinomonadaceae bacterium]
MSIKITPSSIAPCRLYSEIAHNGRGAGIGVLLGAGSGVLYAYILNKRRNY